MKKEQIEFLKSLDPDGIDGTIQSVLMREDLDQCPFENALMFLLKQTMAEKSFLIKQNIELSNGLFKEK